MKKRKVLSIICAAVMAIGGTFIAFGREYKNSNKTATVEKAPVTDNVIIQEEESNAVSLATKKISFDDYAKYNVEPLAESAQLLTATVLPAGVTHTGVEWTLSWVNPSSEWASGKTVTDYLVLTPTSEHALTATLSCLQAFGEQAKATVTSRDDDTKTASSTIDYVQKVTDVSLYFGNVEINLGGETPVIFELNLSASLEDSAPGGKIEADVTSSSIYTIADTFEKNVAFGDFTLEIDDEPVKTDLFGETSYLYGNVYGKSLKFTNLDYICFWFFSRQSGDVSFGNMSTEEIIEQLNKVTNPNIQTVTFTLTGSYNTYSYTSTLVYDGYMNSTDITGVSLSPTTLIF